MKARLTSSCAAESSGVAAVVVDVAGGPGLSAVRRCDVRPASRRSGAMGVPPSLYPSALPGQPREILSDEELASEEERPERI